MSQCATCGVPRGFPAGWSFVTKIDPVTFARTVIWRCPACNYAKAADPRDARHKRAARRGGFQSRAGKLGTTKAGA